MGVAIQIPVLLQIALFLASTAIVIFVVFCIPAMLRLCQDARRIMHALAELKTEASLLVQDSRKLLHNITEVTARAQQQCDDVGHVIQTVRGWTERVDHVVEEVGAVLEPPILKAARNALIIRRGVMTFFETFLKRNHHNSKKAEEDHVR